MKWNKVDVRPKMDVIQDDDIAFMQNNLMNPCLVTDGKHFSEAYMWHVKYKPCHFIGKTIQLKETYEWLFDDRANPVNEMMKLDFIPTHWIYIKDIKPLNNL